MAAKKFGAIYFDDTSLNAGKLLAATPDGFDSTVIVNFCNQNNSLATVTLAYAAADAVSLEPKDYLLFNLTLRPYESYQYTTVALEANHALFVRSATAGVSVIAYGYMDSDE